MTSVLDATAGLDVADYAVQAAVKAGADDAQVSHVYDELFEITYDNNDIGMVRTTVDDQVSLKVFVNGAVGQSSLTGRSHDLIDQAASEAVAAARAGQADPANGVLAGEPAPLVEVGHREPDQEAMLDAITRHQEWMREHHPLVTLREPTYQFRNRWRSFVNSAGVQRQERRGSYSASSTFSAQDGERITSFNGSGASSVELFDELRNVATLQRLLQETEASFDPRAVPETFVGDVIFTPDSADTLIETILQAMTGYSLMRGTSPFQESLGQTIADTRLSVLNRPRSDQFPLAASFDGDGVESQDLPILSDGVLRSFLVDLYTSRKLQRDLTGSVFALDVAPGDATFDEIVAGTERGIILGRFSGGMPNQQLDFSGVAKNSFYVENGKVQFPISETMIAGNFVQMLNQIRTIGNDVVNYGGHAFPSIAAAGVTISTK